jgi:hypothetical protein
VDERPVADHDAVAADSIGELLQLLRVEPDLARRASLPGFAGKDALGRLGPQLDGRRRKHENSRDQ